MPAMKPHVLILIALIAGAAHASHPLARRSAQPHLETLERAELARRWALTWRRDTNEPVVFVPAWGRMVTSLVSDHGSPWRYDTHTPLLVWGPGRVKPGRYGGRVRSVDLMPTLAAVLGRPRDPSLPGKPLEHALVAGAAAPRAVLTVVLDQCGYDGLMRDLDDLPALSRLAREGASFEDCRVEYSPTITALFHATMGTGRWPVEHGISSDKLWDAKAGKYRNAVEDGDPTPIRAPTLMELHHRDSGGRARILSVSQAARASVELAGHTSAAVAYWDVEKERWTTNRRFFRLPEAMAKLTPANVPKSWRGRALDTPKKRSRAPHMARFTGECIARVVEAERLGGGEVTDFVHVNFKETDTAGHDYGNGSEEFRDALRACDQAIGRIVAALERNAGAGGVVVMVTADHGGIPEALRKAGARVDEEELERWLLARLPRRQGKPAWLRDVGNPQIYVIDQGMAAHGYTPEMIARLLERHPAIAAAFTGDELERVRQRDLTTRHIRPYTAASPR
jgi:arylsulfatase A-like enzyme